MRARFFVAYHYERPDGKREFKDGVFDDTSLYGRITIEVIEGLRKKVAEKEGLETKDIAFIGCPTIIENAR